MKENIYPNNTENRTCRNLDIIQRSNLQKVGTAETWIKGDKTFLPQNHKRNFLNLRWETPVKVCQEYRNVTKQTCLEKKLLSSHQNTKCSQTTTTIKDIENSQRERPSHVQRQVHHYNCKFSMETLKTRRDCTSVHNQRAHSKSQQI